MATMETTLLILKPDAVERGLIGRIVGRFEEKGLEIVGLKMIRLDEALAREHYAEHAAKPFFPGLLRFITAGPVVVAAVRGLRAVEVCRALMGATFGWKSAPGTIRGDFGMSSSYNLIHGSDSPAAAERELARFFRPGEIHDREPAARTWTYDAAEEL